MFTDDVARRAALRKQSTGGPHFPLHAHASTKTNTTTVFTDADLHYMRQGTHCTMYSRMGAHLEVLDGAAGVRFTVWAPNAQRVSVLTDANHWKHDANVLKRLEDGVWTGFIPDMTHGDIYKFGIKTAWGHSIEKSDPYAFHSEVRPKTASVVYDLSRFPWQDHEWLRRREASDPLERPISVYELHLGSWRRPRDGRTYFNYRELAHELVDYVRDLGFTYIELMPVNEHPFDGSWGYQSTGYFAPTSRFGTPHDFMYFVDYCHRAGIGVIIDWVPAHFPNDGHGLATFDGTCLFEHSDPRQGQHPDWGTAIFNFGRNEVRNFLLSSARFWFDKYHVDGIRVDAVASMLYLDYSRQAGEWVPNCYGGRENLEAVQFLKDMNVMLHGEYPGILTVAEESTAWPGVSRPVYVGGLGFSFKWDMGWMNDTLRFMHREPVHRAYHLNDLSFRMVYAFTENFVLPLSHDEVVHGKGALLSQQSGDYWQKFANLRLLYSYQYTMPGKKLLFMGSELGQWNEWNHDGELDWLLLDFHSHRGIWQLLRDLNRIYASQGALHERDSEGVGFSWIQCDDWANSVFAFIRFAIDRDDFVVAILNFTPVPREDYRIGVPRAGWYGELINTDSEVYGGSNLGNAGGIQSEEIPSHGHPHSISITLPPLAMVLFKPQ